MAKNQPALSTKILGKNDKEGLEIKSGWVKSLATYTPKKFWFANPPNHKAWKIKEGAKKLGFSSQSE